MLFATLDPTMRLLRLPHGGSAILSDTVGFISDLPTMLISAFRATLEEVRAADVILHVRDIAHADTDAQAQDVRAILADLGVTAAADKLIEVWNKLDQLDGGRRAGLSLEQGPEGPVAVSALTGEGVDKLLEAIEFRLAQGRSLIDLSLDGADGQGLHWLYEHTEVMGARRRRRRTGERHRARGAGDGGEGAEEVRGRRGLRGPGGLAPFHFCMP